MPSNVKCAAAVALQSLISLASAYLVRYSIVVIIYLAPVHFLGGLIRPMKSMVHFSNACRVICSASGILSPLDGFPIL
jgi:hypothetical protein